MIVPVFHLSVVTFNLFTLWYDQQYVNFPLPGKGYNEMPYKARHVFLTYWCFILQTVYFSLAFLNDVLGTNAPSPRKTPAIRMLKDTIFSMAFPAAIHVCSTFWTLIAIDRNLVMPDAIARAMPVWFNHTLHTFVSVFILMEFLLTSRSYPSRIIGGSLSAAFAISYIVWLHVLYDRTGVWVYPIFGVLNLPQRMMFLLCSIVVVFGLYVLGEKMNNVFSGSKHSNETKRKKK